MATVTKPIALDESFNTTEVTPRNIADVLAEGLSHITGRTASEVEYDNTDSGLTADNVQDAIDEVNGKVPTLPSVDIQTAVDEFETYNGGLLSECKVSLSPIQDLHGYAEPWVGGAGKNKLPLTVTNIKSLNGGAGTWIDNKKTIQGIEYTLYADDNDNCIAIKANRLSAGSDNSFLALATDLSFMTAGTNYTMNGCPSNGDTTTYGLVYYGVSPSILKWDLGDGITYTAVDSSSDPSAIVRIVIRANANISDLIFKPMIRLATESDPTFEPYSNICPISGHTEVDLYNVGKNLFDYTQATSGKRIDITNGQFDNASAFHASDYIHVESGKTYTLNFVYYSAADYGMAYYDTSKTFVSGVKQRVNVGDTKFTFTVPSGCNYIRFTIDSSIDIDNVQLEVGSDVTNFEPYNDYQLTVNLGGTYYSGTIDIVSGMFVVNKAYCKLADQTLIKRTTSTSDIYRFAFVPNPAVQIGQYVNVISNALVSGDAYSSYSSRVENCITPDTSGNYINFFASDKQTDTDWITFATNNDVEIVYPLATPQSIQLSPTMVKALVGENHLSAPLDGQEITESKYKQMFTFDDVIAYIQSLS